jgi:PIN domain nuclease of toxin-antitoxin system
VRLLLDTVIFIWALESPDRISRKAMALLQNQDTVRELSSISVSEMAIKTSIGKLNFTQTDLQTGIADLELRILPYTGEHALQLFSLPPHHSDPFDRQLISQAIFEDIPIVSCDSKFKLYKNLRTIW